MSKTIAMIYGEEKRKLDSKRGDKHRRKYSHNTYVERNGGSPALLKVRYHDTDVVEILPDRVTLNSGGWRTPTTKERINWFLPEGVYLYQEKSVWYLCIGDWEAGEKWYFEDGMIIKEYPLEEEPWNKYTVSGAKKFSETDKRTQRAKRNELKRIREYAEKYVERLYEGKIDKPSGGDCWYCYMQVEGRGGELKSSLGDISGNSEHLKSHIKHKYYVPSLIINAMERFPMSLSVMGAIGYLVYDIEEGRGWAENFRSATESQIKGSLIRYLKEGLGYAG